LLAGLSATATSEHVFPGRGTPHRVDIKKDWQAVCDAAGIVGARIHDLRHSFASILVGGGLSLPIIGRLLGHTQQATTHRYAHLAIEPLQEATERVGAFVSGGKAADVVPLSNRGGR